MASYLLLCCHIVWKLPKKSHLDEWVIISIKNQNYDISNKNYIYIRYARNLEKWELFVWFSTTVRRLVVTFSRRVGRKNHWKRGDNCPVCVVGRKLENDGIHVTLILLVLTAFIFIPFNTLRWNFRRQRETSYPSVDPIKCNEKERADCFPQISSSCTLFCAAREHF